jgi:hypothetical protein
LDVVKLNFIAELKLRVISKPELIIAVIPQENIPPVFVTNTSAYENRFDLFQTPEFGRRIPVFRISEAHLART